MRNFAATKTGQPANCAQDFRICLGQGKVLLIAVCPQGRSNKLPVYGPASFNPQTTQKILPTHQVLTTEKLGKLPL